MPSCPRPRSHVAIAAGILAWALVVATPSSARADARTELEKARAAFVARNWGEAEARLMAVLDPKQGVKERSILSQARMYLGASKLLQGHTAEARDVFEKLALDDPTYEPDPLSFPGEAINLFIDVRASLLEQIQHAQQAAARLASERKAKEEADREARRLWLEQITQQAAEERVTVRHSRIVASLPFGAGQFQNGQRALGWIFLGAEAAFVAGTVVTYGMYAYARDRENEALSRPFGDINGGLVPRYHQRAEDLRVANLSFAGAFALSAIAGIVHAHVTFVPERSEIRKRPLPDAARMASSRVRGWAPFVAPTFGESGSASGLVLGVSGFSF